MSLNIKLVRVDPRLLHATVVINWGSFLNANYAVLVDSKYEKNPFIEKVMSLYLPPEFSVRIFDVDGFIEFLNEKSEDMRNAMIIFKDFTTAREAFDKGFYVKELQLSYPASRVMLKDLSKYYSKDEIEEIEKIKSKNIKLYFQTSPFDSKDYSLF